MDIDIKILYKILANQIQHCIERIMYHNRTWDLSQTCKVGLMFKNQLIWLITLWGSAGKESACNAKDLDLIPGLGRSPGEGKRYPLQYSGLENSMAHTVHGVTKRQTQLKRLSSSSNQKLKKKKDYVQYLEGQIRCLILPNLTIISYVIFRIMMKKIYGQKYLGSCSRYCT